MMNLLLENYKKHIDYYDTYEVPMFVKNENSLYIYENDLTLQFLEEYVVKEEVGVLKKSELKVTNNSNRRDYGIAMKYNEFIKEVERILESKFIKYKQIKGVRYNDIKLRGEECEVGSDSEL